MHFPNPFRRPGGKELGYKIEKCSSEDNELLVPEDLAQLWYSFDVITRIEKFLIVALIVTKEQFDLLHGEKIASNQFQLPELQSYLQENKNLNPENYYRTDNIRVITITYNRSESSTK